MQKIIIRKFKKSDRPAVRTIACDTAFLGKPVEAFFEGREIIADFLTRYFTDYEPQSCFIAEVNTETAGYLLGAKDTARLARVAFCKIALPLLVKIVFRAALFNRKNLTFLCRMLLSCLRGELKTPELHELYPATLHINLAARFRSQGLGSDLIESYLAYLRQEQVAGVYLATISTQAAAFFERCGFSLLHQSKRSYFRHILQHDLPCDIYAKKL